MLSIKDPLILYWLHTSGILDSIKKNLQERLNVDISLDLLKIRTDGEVSTLEVLAQFNKEIEEQIGSFKMDSIQNIPEQVYSQALSTLSEKYSKDKLTIINCQQESKQIKSLIQESKLSNGLNEYENYYELQNMIYIFARWNIADQVLRAFTKNQFNDSLNEETIYYNKPDVKVEDISLGTKIGQFDGAELWNCKYKNIPHTYVRFKDASWEQGAKKNVLHTSHPKYVPGLSLCPPLQRLNPSKQKLPQLISFLKTLQQSFPNHYPTIDSLFESNGKLIAFTKQNNYKINRGWLCYRVAVGQISYQGYLRWLKHNPKSQIAKYNTSVEQHYQFSQL